MTNNVHADSYVSSADSKKDVKGRSSNVKEDDFSLDGTTTTTGQVLVQDEDARLLARIGYKQVRLYYADGDRALLTASILGASTRVQQVVNSVICHLCTGCARIAAGHVWRSHQRRRPGDGGLGLVHWIVHGVCYCEFRCVQPYPFSSMTY
jgi:hypothetical protein